jgi:hypothetical protein
MEASPPYVIDLPQELEDSLKENGVDLVAALRDEGLDVRRGPVPEGAPIEKGGKAVLLTLLVAGVTASMLASAIAKVLDSISRNKKYLVTEDVLLPVVDGSGKPVKDADGQATMYWAERSKLIESTQVTQDKSNLMAEVRPTRLTFKLKSGS